jgi:hypothetical protein
MALTVFRSAQVSVLVCRGHLRQERRRVVDVLLRVIVVVLLGVVAWAAVLAARRALRVGVVVRTLLTGLRHPLLV